LPLALSMSFKYPHIYCEEKSCADFLASHVCNIDGPFGGTLFFILFVKIVFVIVIVFLIRNRNRLDRPTGDYGLAYDRPDHARLFF